MVKKLEIAVLLAACIAASVLKAQTVSPSTIKQYHTMVAKCNGAQPASYDACRQQLLQYGFVDNSANSIDIFTMKMLPFYRAEGNDTVTCVLGVVDGSVHSIGGGFISLDAGRAYTLVAKASKIQAELAAQYGCTKYVGSVKGKVKKVTTNHEELLAALESVDADIVSMVYESWKSDDGNRMITLVYNNKRYGKKSPKDKDRIELTLSVGNTMKE